MSGGQAWYRSCIKSCDSSSLYISNASSFSLRRLKPACTAALVSSRDIKSRGCCPSGTSPGSGKYARMQISPFTGGSCLSFQGIHKLFLSPPWAMVSTLSSGMRIRPRKSSLSKMPPSSASYRSSSSTCPFTVCAVEQNAVVVGRLMPSPTFAFSTSSRPTFGICLPDIPACLPALPPVPPSFVTVCLSTTFLCCISTSFVSISDPPTAWTVRRSKLAFFLTPLSFGSGRFVGRAAQLPILPSHSAPVYTPLATAPRKPLLEPVESWSCFIVEGKTRKNMLWFQTGPTVANTTFVRNI
mmetsp:Transcript_32204/g.81012  ORF Transcript_32204/g.81012 Transcript_32204/m.81012 type:complete len:298 (-) Transcript_32204:1364-2257(-)